MSPEERAHFEGRLTALRDALRDAGTIEAPKIRDDAVGKVDDDTTPLTEMLQVIASSRNRQHAQVLRQVLGALQKLQREPEDYGLCVECDEPIKRGRLELMPYVELCVRCQSAQEEGAAQRGGRRHLTDYD